MTFSDLRKNLKNDFTNFRKIKLALLGDSATQFMNQALKGYGFEQQLDLQIFEADYDQVDQQLMNPDSGLYASQSEIVLVFNSSQKLLKRFYKTPIKDRGQFAEQQLVRFKSYYEVLQQRSGSKMILCNFPEINDGVFGNYANKINTSFIYQLRKLNLGLMDMSSLHKDLFLYDLITLQNLLGTGNFTDPKNYISADMTLSLEALPLFAKGIVEIISSITGKFRKCLVLDLDNTLWGGVIGDDGLEKIQIGDLGIGKAFTELQQWALELKRRGIILAVCSKNTESIAREAFEKHPDMVLSLDDIALFVANWENKVDNLRYIQETLNIGFDSMVFLDDNPFERNMVKENLPAIIVPELPEDPAEYVCFLRNANLFETASFSENDESRTAQYKQEAKRVEVKKSFTNVDDYLRSLEMIAVVAPFNKFNVPRVAQLTQRSNQFNLRTQRYTEEDVKRMAASDKFITLTFQLKDKYGDNGLISVVVLSNRKDYLFIDTWIMSCRVLKRGMENFVLNKIVSKAKEAGFGTLAGEYIPTQKNVIVKDHYSDLGFKEKKGLWFLEISDFRNMNNFIKEKEMSAA